MKIKKNAIVLGIAMMSFFLFNAGSTFAQGKLVTVKSTKNFEETIAGIKKSVAGGGMMVLSELNQGKILSMTGLTINAESLFIGNPTVGKEAFSDNAAVGLAIPVRLNVYEENGATYINYFTPSGQMSHFKGEKVKMIGEKMDKKMEMLVSMFTH